MVSTSKTVGMKLIKYIHERWNYWFWVNQPSELNIWAKYSQLKIDNKQQIIVVVHYLGNETIRFYDEKGYESLVIDYKEVCRLIYDGEFGKEPMLTYKEKSTFFFNGKQYWKGLDENGESINGN